MRHLLVFGIFALCGAIALVMQAEAVKAAFPGTNGKIMFTSLRDGNEEIYVMNADGTDQTNLTNNPANDANGAWSPDGTKIAFNSSRTGDLDIYVMNADGSDVHNLTNHLASDGTPTWSADGDKIVFSSDRNGSSDIYVMNADGSGVTSLTNDPSTDFSPSMSPDGTRIAFVSNRDPDHGDWSIYVMNADGSNVSPDLFPDDVEDYDPTWLPDGSRILFWSGAGSSHNVYSINPDGSEAINLTPHQADDGHPNASPDGNQIVFSSNRNGTYKICLIANTGEPALVNCVTTNADGPSYFPRWQPAPLRCAITVLAPFGGPNLTAVASLPLTLAKLQAHYTDPTGLGSRIYNASHHLTNDPIPNPYWVDVSGPFSDEGLVARQFVLHSRMAMLKADVDARGGSMNIDSPPASAFRPLLYQGHFWNVRFVSRNLVKVLDYWNAVLDGMTSVVGSMPDADACGAIASAVNEEQAWHVFNIVKDTNGQPLPPYHFETPDGLSISVPRIGKVCHPTSEIICPHTTGSAVDAPFMFMSSTTTVDQLAAQRGVRRVYGSGDRAHFEATDEVLLLPGPLPIEIIFNSPVLGLVTDPQGRRIGFDASTQHEVNEIGHEASYSGIFGSPQIIEIDAPLEGVYQIGGLGTGTGPYTIVRVLGNEEGHRSILLATGTAMPGVQIETVDMFVSADSLPPSTLVSVEPAPSMSGWNKSNVLVAITAVETGGGSGVSDITYEVHGAEEIQRTTVPGSAVSLPLSNEGTSVVTFSSSDIAGNTETPRSFSIRIDRTSPVVVSPPDRIVQQTLDAGAVVTYPPPVIVEDGSGVASSGCFPASGSIFPVGVSVATCTATDAAGNTGSDAFTVTVKAAPDGRMFGNGFVDVGGKQHHFTFLATQQNSHEFGRLEYWVLAPSRRHEDDDDDRDGDYGREHRNPQSRFEATSIGAVTFSDDPTFRPDGRRQSAVDSVSVYGVGKWNSRPGFLFEMIATDHGEPGRHRDTFSLIVRDRRGKIVANVSGDLDGGNIQSTRLGR